MKPLEKSLRSQLESTVKRARQLAEAAARAALEELGIGEAAPPAHLNDKQRDLRRRLRVHGRQLGDSLNGGKLQSMERLLEEVACEHWHRMLFARFLAENNLLMYPDSSGSVAVSLEECAELAADEGAANGWELAARFAGQMLPQIFRVDSPVFALKLPANYQVPLEKLLAALPVAVFTASDSLGWVYQFWQADNKDRINNSEVKIGARELPAVTQLFTEPYMVSFLLDNALGAWWADKRLSEQDLRKASSEDELRRKTAIPGVPLEYLRFVREADADGNQRWTPAAGTFPGWPEKLSELKCLDPCCGSGHFLVSLLLMLVPLRMEREGLDARAAVDAVLRENIHGLELDARCVELAAFALALTAWRYPGAGGYRPLPEIQVACSGLSVSVAKDEWKALAREGGLGGQNLAIAMDWLHDTFRDAPVLGSLLNPAKTDAAKIVQWDQLSAALNKALAQETTDEQHEVAVVAQGLAKAATLLAGQYGWVITNVPYLARGKQDERLRNYCEKHYPAAKHDLATVFLARCLELACLPSPSGRGAGGEGALQGTVSVVLPQNWLFLTSYRKFREKLLNEEIWNLIARLGPGAFETISGEVVKAILITLTHGQAGGHLDGAHGGLFAGEASGHLLRGVDVSEPKTAADKAAALLSAEVKSVEQAGQLGNPDARVSLEEQSSDPLLNSVADYGKGSTTGDSPRFVRHFWEVREIEPGHTLWLNSPTVGDAWSGRSMVCISTTDAAELRMQLGCRIHGQTVWSRNGVAVCKMRSLDPFLYSGEVFDDNVCPIAPRDETLVPAIWAFVSSPSFSEAARKLDQKLNVTAATITKVPFDLAHWTQVAAEQYPNGLPQPYTNDPTQWTFHGHPCGAVIWDDTAKWTAHGPLRADDTVLHIAVARLLGYRWPAELDAEMELAAEQREWANRCEALLPFADSDGIVCIPAVRGEAPADQRLRNLLAAAYGEAWSSAVESQLLASVEHAGKSLESWLRERFFSQHCKLFEQRPFIWHIWDGLSDGFAVLVNYHKLDRKNLETLIYTYLGDWISRQKQDIASGIDGAQERLAAAEALKQRLELVLKGEAPYDVFVRWKPLAEQPIGWDPDLNDGVRLNIRPFLSVPDLKKKGAGVLRDKPNIKWDKDRGKDVETAPWFSEFGGDRINDHHLSLSEKLAARKVTS